MEIKLYQDTWLPSILHGSATGIAARKVAAQDNYRDHVEKKRRDKRETCYKVVREKGAREAFLSFFFFFVG